jgi:hypothetical protein
MGALCAMVYQTGGVGRGKGPHLLFASLCFPSNNPPPSFVFKHLFYIDKCCISMGWITYNPASWLSLSYPSKASYILTVRNDYALASEETHYQSVYYTRCYIPMGEYKGKGNRLASCCPSSSKVTYLSPSTRR